VEHDTSDDPMRKDTRASLLGPGNSGPLEQRSLEALDRLIALGREPKRRMAQVRRVRRNKFGGTQSGRARAAVSDDRAGQMRATANQLRAAGHKRVVNLLMAKFDVSRSTVMRALRSQTVSRT